MSKFHAESGEMAAMDERVWVTRRGNAFVAKYCEVIRNIEKEFLTATPTTKPPEKQILDAVKLVLKKKKSVRVIRQITPQLTCNELDEYKELIRLGDQVRYLKYDGLRFAVFDKKGTVLMLPPRQGSQFAV